MIFLGLHCDMMKLNRWLELVGCGFGSFPLVLLRAISFWDGLIENIRKRLASRKKSFFSSLSL